MIHIRVPIYIKKKNGKYYPFVLNNNYTHKSMSCSFKSGLLEQFRTHLLTLTPTGLYDMRDVPAKKLLKLVRFFLIKRIYVLDFYFDIYHHN